MVAKRERELPSWAVELSDMLGAMRDVHGALIELQAREARLFEVVDRVARRVIDDAASRAVDEAIE